jgi:hypothetical protein
MTFLQFTLLFKYTTVGLFAILVIIKIILIEVYKAKSEDYIPGRIFWFYSSVEIYGTDLHKRRKFMLKANKMTGWIYGSLVLMLIAFSLPSITKILDIAG